MMKKVYQTIKKIIVSFSGTWFYPTKKLPVGTHFLLFLKHRVSFPLNIIFDVGANVGTFTKDLIQIWPQSEYYCFEPFSDTFQKLKINLSSSSVHLYQVALADFSGVVSVSLFDSDRSDTNSLVAENQPLNSSNLEQIKVITLDEFVETNSIELIDLLKIDTEGFDLKVLKGAKESLKKGVIKLIFVECGLDPSNRSHVYFPEILSFLTDNKYVFVGFFQTDIRKIDRKIHFSNGLFVHESSAKDIITFS